MSSNGPEQKSQFPRKKRKSQSDGEAPTKTYDNEDEVKAFFSLVDRIRAVGKLLKSKSFDISSVTEVSTSLNVDSTAIEGKSSWKPSLKWEDFSYMTGKVSQRDLTSVVSKESDIIRTDKSNQMRSFDLNVEASSEQRCSEEH